MRRTATFLLALAASMAGIAHAAPPAMQTVESVDLKRYAGMWYEIANFPMFFQHRRVLIYCDKRTATQDKASCSRSQCRRRHSPSSSVNGGVPP